MIDKTIKYCESTLSRKRRPTHVVYVGDVGVGGSNPVRIQSMTTTDTMDTIGTVEQVRKLMDAGCEIVRITAPSIKDAENLKLIKDEMKKQGLSVPLVADIHFTPNAALKAAEIVEKVRINPGNYADKKKFEIKEYTDSEYMAELERIHDKFAPLVKKCKENGIAMRIGTNHGSLSDRIMNRYGDTPEGMVESALEFVRIAEIYNYRNIILSMKSSNTQVMIQAYRILSAKMYELGMTYPFHLGVTEAGDGEDGRIKSALGIGSLLEDGLGDTIRVSLTEDPWFEIEPAFQIANPYQKEPETPYRLSIEKETYRNPFLYQRVPSDQVKGNRLNVGEGGLIRAGITLPTFPSENELKNLLQSSGAITAVDDPKLEFIALPLSEPSNTTQLEPFSEMLKQFDFIPELIIRTSDVGLLPDFLPYPFSFIWIDLMDELSIDSSKKIKALNRPVVLSVSSDCKDWVTSLTKSVENLNQSGATHLLLSADFGNHTISAYRELLEIRDQQGWSHPFIVESVSQSFTDADILSHSTRIGSLLTDGIGDLVMLKASAPPRDLNRVLFNILQAARQRSTKTEYISCPSCGRTLFNLQSTTERIKSKTSHLKGVKIAIMGCIVNGPGEMADADFGYVGSGPGKIDLYVGKTVIKKNIPQDQADDQLIQLIKSHDKWIEPKAQEPIQ